MPLAEWVHVDGKVFGRGDEPEERYARLITNPAAWEGGVAPALEVASAPPPVDSAPAGGSTSSDRPGSAVGTGGAGPVSIPPKSGKGSSAAAWKKYAEAMNVVVEGDPERHEIIDALVKAGVPTED